VPVSDHIRKKLSQVPHKPGVYLHKDRFGTVIYVGKARDLRKRVSQYFHPSRRLGWDLKFNALVEAIHDFDVHVVKSEPEALLLESKLIKEFHPRFNVSLRDDKRFLLLKVNLSDPIPNFAFTRLKKDDGARYFGPFVNSTAARNTVALVRKQFNLRGCRVFTPGEADYKHCLYAHLKYCTAPCVNNVTREQYLEQVNAACDFLTGQCQEMKEQLEAEMRKAAAAHEFEKAADLRDMIQDLERTTKREKSFARVPYSLPLAINPEKDLWELAKVLGLSKPPQRIEGFDISNISGTFKVASLVSFKNGRPDRANYRRFKIKSVEGQDDFASMAEVIRRRYTRVLNESKGQGPKANVEEGDRDEGGEPIAQELQKLIDETSKRIKRQMGDSRWKMGETGVTPPPTPSSQLPAPNKPMFEKLSELLRDKADTVTFTVARENDTQLRVNFYPRLNHTNTHVEQGLNTPLQIVATPAEFDGPEFLAAIARFNTSAQGLVAAVETVEAAHKAAATTASTPAPKGKTPVQVAAKKAETKPAETEEEEEPKADEGGSLDI